MFIFSISRQTDGQSNFATKNVCKSKEAISHKVVFYEITFSLSQIILSSFLPKLFYTRMPWLVGRLNFVSFYFSIGLAPTN